MLSSFAPAKVNLFLHVTGKRADGYHLLDSLAVFPAIGDRISYEQDTELTLTTTGRYGASLKAEPDNLVLRAARLLASQAGLRANGRLTLEKNLPVASGIGGGSADAAATLRLLAGVWNVDTPLHDIALALGADVPVCVGSTPARMTGIGEILSPTPRFPPFGIMLVNPGVPVATREVFRARPSVFSAPANLSVAWPNAAAMAHDVGRQHNDLETAAQTLQPAIGEVLTSLRAIPGVLLARMSGSGATCFALLETPAAAAEAAEAVIRPGWWCWGGGLYEPGVVDL